MGIIGMVLEVLLGVVVYVVSIRYKWSGLDGGRTNAVVWFRLHSTREVVIILFTFILVLSFVIFCFYSVVCL